MSFLSSAKSQKRQPTHLQKECSVFCINYRNLENHSPGQAGAALISSVPKDFTFQRSISSQRV